MQIKQLEESELIMKPFDNQHRPSNTLHPNLLQPPFSLLLVGPKGSGKSNVIIRLLYGNRKPKGAKNDHHKFYRHYFDKVYIFSPTWKNDPKTERCGIPDDQIFEDPEYYQDILAEILGMQYESIEEEGKEETDEILLVFSDLAGAKGVFSSSKGIMNKLAFNHRHYNASIMIDSQAIRQINSAFRENFSGVILFAGITNRMEIAKIYEEYLGEFTKEEANKLLKYVFDDNRYNFLFINFQKSKEKRFFKNFAQLLIKKDSDSSLV